MKIGSRASTKNLALQPFEVLLGEWVTTGTHPYVPNTILHGRTSFERLEGGAFLLMRSEIDDSHFPHGLEIFGSDDVARKFYMLHFDERGVSRKFDVTIDGKRIVWWRDEPSFSQRYILNIEDGGNTFVSKGEMSKNGGDWEKDLELTCIRRQ